MGENIQNDGNIYIWEQMDDRMLIVQGCAWELMQNQPQEGGGK